MPIEELWSQADEARRRRLVDVAGQGHVGQGIAPGELASALFAIEGASPEREARARLELSARAERVRAGSPGASPREQAELMASALSGYRGREEAYYDVESSHLSRVVESGHGMPILLSVVWILVGREAGVPVAGVGLPGHFIVRVGDGDGDLRDPFGGGGALSLADCRALVGRLSGGRVPFREEMLAAASPSDIVVRVLKNLLGSCQRLDDAVSAYRVARLWTAVEPDVPAPLLAQARFAESAGARHEAGVIYQALLSRFGGSPEAREAESGRDRLVRLGPLSLARSAVGEPRRVLPLQGARPPRQPAGLGGRAPDHRLRAGQKAPPPRARALAVGNRAAVVLLDGVGRVAAVAGGRARRGLHLPGGAGLRRRRRAGRARRRPGDASLGSARVQRERRAPARALRAAPRRKGPQGARVGRHRAFRRGHVRGRLAGAPAGDVGHREGAHPRRGRQPEHARERRAVEGRARRARAGRVGAARYQRLPHDARCRLLSQGRRRLRHAARGLPVAEPRDVRRPRPPRPEPRPQRGGHPRARRPYRVSPARLDRITDVVLRCSLLGRDRSREGAASLAIPLFLRGPLSTSPASCSRRGSAPVPTCWRP